MGGGEEGWGWGVVGGGSRAWILFLLKDGAPISNT